MEREIKFRAWDGKEMLYTGMFVKPTHLVDYPMDCFSQVNVYHNKVEVWFLETNLPHATLEYYDHPTYIQCKAYMQFTGLLDKNKKEIYEGDIVTYGYKTGVIVWYAYDAMFILADTSVKCVEKQFADKTPYEVYLSGGHCVEYDFVGNKLFPNNKPEIIGNIHANPELLTTNTTTL